jgi:hypothetical protein
MRKRRHINADPDMPTLRSSVAAATEPVRDAAWAVEQRVVWRGADELRRITEVVRWPFERAAWALERFVVWPMQELAAGRVPSLGISGIAGAGAVCSALAVVGIVLATNGGGSADRVVIGAAPSALTQPVALDGQADGGPVLHGVDPSFRVGSGVGVAQAPAAGEGGESLASIGSSDPTSVDAGGASASSSASAAPAGPVAMRVARRFAEAFVFYEIGRRPDRTEAVFSETAVPALAEALSKRPPRLPAGTEVPKARVVNLVPGPRSGQAYTVSVSLLRVGVTSELRLEMQKVDGAWAVADVRG